MRNERQYVTINYNTKLKEKITVTFYTIIGNSFGCGMVVNKLSYKYNNLYHFLKNENNQIQRLERETGCEVLENASIKDILFAYNNMA